MTYQIGLCDFLLICKRFLQGLWSRVWRMLLKLEETCRCQISTFKFSHWIIIANAILEDHIIAYFVRLPREAKLNEWNFSSPLVKNNEMMQFLNWHLFDSQWHHKDSFLLISQLMKRSRLSNNNENRFRFHPRRKTENEVIWNTKELQSFQLQCNPRYFFIQLINKSKFIAHYSTLSGKDCNFKCHNNNLSWDSATCSDNHFLRIAFILHTVCWDFCFSSGTWESTQVCKYVVSCGAEVYMSITPRAFLGEILVLRCWAPLTIEILEFVLPRIVSFFMNVWYLSFSRRRRWRRPFACVASLIEIHWFMSFEFWPHTCNL